MTKPTAWMLLLATTASFAATVVLGRAEERHQQVRAEVRQPPAAFADFFQRMSASASASASFE